MHAYVMETERRRVVVVIQDGSRQLNPKLVRWALRGLLLKPGDKLTLVCILHEVITPMGYKIKIDTGSKLGANMRIIKDAAETMKKKYHNNSELAEITRLFEAQKVEVIIEVVAGTSRKDMVIEAAQKQKATWLLLDRYMKKDESYFLQKLSCGISRMKNNLQVEELQGPDASTIFGNIHTSIIENSNSNHIKKKTTPRSNLTIQQVFNINVLPGIPEVEEEETDSENVENNRETTSENVEDSVSTNGVSLLQFTNGTTSLNSEEIPQSTTVHTSEDVTPVMSSNTLNPTIECKINFTYEEMHTATNGFSVDNSLCDGESIYGFVGKLENEVKVVVKKSNCLILEDFEFEVNVMRKARHKNIIRILGFCSEANHRLIVYESACNGLLRPYILEESSRQLTWTTRIKVALGVARGLLFLHENRLIHNDIRSNNIFLTHELDPLVGYFSIAKTKYEYDDVSDYRAPECEELGIVSSKTDVYSFGMVLLELISGRIATQQTAIKTDLLGWATSLMKNKKNYEELLDPRLVSSHDRQQFYWMVGVTKLCLAKDPKKRVTMDRVVSALEFIWARDHSCGIVEK